MTGAVRLDERQHAPPGVFAGILVLGEAAVEERVGRAVVDGEGVRLPGGGEGFVEGVHGGLRDARIRTAEEAEEGGGVLVHAVDRGGRAIARWADRATVEADRPGEAEAVRRL
jgi:hypothetical protein